MNNQQRGTLLHEALEDAIMGRPPTAFERHKRRCIVKGDEVGLEEVMLAELAARKAIEKGYYQVSARYGLLARLPEGKTGVEALAEASGRPDWAQLLGELHAGDHYLRCYGTDRIELDSLAYLAFRSLGGGPYTSRPNPPKTETEQLRDALRTIDALKQRVVDLERQLKEARDAHEQTGGRP